MAGDLRWVEHLQTYPRSHEQKREYYVRMLSYPYLHKPADLPGFDEWYDHDTQLTIENARWSAWEMICNQRSMT